jgi:F420H(2)-dependent quinone reductase
MTSTESLPTVSAPLNWLVRTILRSPIHRMFSGSVMLVTVTGRRSGSRYVIAVRYMRDNDEVTCFTDSGWWKNLRGGAPVEMLIKRRTVQGVGAPVLGYPDAVASGLQTFLHVFPGDSKYYAVRRHADGTPDPDDVRRAAERTTMIRIQPAPARA